MIRKGRIISIDVAGDDDRPQHSRITYFTGSSVSDDVVSRVPGAASRVSAVVVVLDSDHSESHVLRELTAFAPLVTPGC